MSSVVPPVAQGRGILLLAIAGFCWGTGGIAGSILGTRAGLHPLSVATYRLLLGGLLLTLLLLVTARARLGSRLATLEAGRRVAVAGGLLALFQVGYFAAISLTSVSIATMVTIGSVPVFVATGSAIGSRRAPSALVAGSVGIAVLGLVLLSWPRTGAQAGDAGGVACALLAAAGFSALTLVLKRPDAGLDPLRTAAFGCLAGGLILLPAALMVGVTVPLRADVIAAAVYLGAVPTALAYGAYFGGLRLSHPVRAALSALLEPLTATTLLAVTLLGDRLGVAGWCGAGLLIGAVALGQLRPAERA